MTPGSLSYEVGTSKPHFNIQIISVISWNLLEVSVLAWYIAVSGQWGFLIKLPDLLCLDFSEKVIIFNTVPRKRLLGQRISLGFKLGGGPHKTFF